MDELRVIKPDKNNRLSSEDLEWIGASECTIACTGCGKDLCRLYESWGNEDGPYCAKCLIEGWEEAVGDG